MKISPSGQSNLILIRLCLISLGIQILFTLCRRVLLRFPAPPSRQPTCSRTFPPTTEKRFVRWRVRLQVGYRRAYRALLVRFAHLLGSFYVSVKLPTYPSPKPTLTRSSYLGQNIGQGSGRWAVSQKRKMIRLLYRLPRKSNRTELLFTQKNGSGGATSAPRRAAPTSKVESHIPNWRLGQLSDMVVKTAFI